MSSQESSEDSSSSSSSSSDEDEYFTNDKKRKLDISSSPSSFKKIKAKEEEEEEQEIIPPPIPPPMKTLLGELSDEIVEHILDYIPKPSYFDNYSMTIPLSCVSKQFRRVWKRTTFGIVYNMIIELNYNMRKHSMNSLEDQIEIGQQVKHMIFQYFNSKESEKTLQFLKQQTPRFIEQLTKQMKENQSQNFTNAISKITRFDYGEERGVECGVAIGNSSGMEIEFENPNGMIKCWHWKEIYVKHEDSQTCCAISESLRELNLTKDEWNIILTTAGKYVGLDCIGYNDYEFKKNVSSVFDDYELDVRSELE